MESLDGWILEEVIGSGGLAEVWRAVPEAGGRPVAIKVLREPDRSRAHRHRFLREGLLLARFNHPGLPRCYSVQDGERPYLVLELLRGANLQDRLSAGGPIPPDQVAAVAVTLLRVLAFLHDQGVIHRDVKPSNIYLGDNRRVVLLDLGLAVDPADPLSTTLGDVMGTYAYMAPEQIAGAEVDHRADLYSLGVTLYEALAGDRPFHARGAAGYLRAHREGNAASLAEICPDAPARLADTITRLMARDPLARPASASIALALLTGASGANRRLRKPPLVGRAAALGALHAALDGSGTVLLRGETGSGTGRLAAEALTLARASQAEVIAIRCRGRAPPLDPVDQLRRDLGRVSGRSPDSIEALIGATDALGREGPLLLLIEDAEQCSPAAAELLAKVIAAAPEMSTVVTGVEIPPSITGHLVQLRSITAEETLQIVAGMLGTPSPPAGLAAQLHHMAGGLPAVVVLAVKELVGRRALWCEGVSDDGSVRWRLDRNAPIEPTTGLVRLFGAMLQSLPAGPRRILEVLAVAGEALPMSIAVAIAETDPSGEATLPLSKAGLISLEQHPDDEWVVLRRPALGALVLAQVNPDLQAALHRGLVEHLRRLPPDPWRDGRITWHAAFGALPEDAPRALLDLGLDLYQRGQCGLALSVLDRGSRIPGAPTAVAAALAIARGECLAQVARREESANALGAGRQLAEELGDLSLQARAIVGLAQVHHDAGDARRAATLAEDALTLLQDRPADPSLPRALLLAADSNRLGALPDAAAALYHRCIAVARSQGDEEHEALGHGGLGILLGEEGHLQEAVDHFHTQGGWLRARGRSQHLVPNLYRMSVSCRRLGWLDAALEALDEAEEVAIFARLPFERALARIGRAAIMLALGEIRVAQGLLDSARIAADPEASAFLRLAFRDVQASIRLASGDKQAALAVYQGAEEDASRAGFAAIAAFHLGMAGVLTADSASLTRAMDVLSVAGDRTYAARLLFHGATVGGDVDILDSTREETEHSGDRFLILSVLHACGGEDDAREAASIAAAIYERTPQGHRHSLMALPAVKWSGFAPVIEESRR